MKGKLKWVETSQFVFEAFAPGVRYCVECTNRTTRPANEWWDAFSAVPNDIGWRKLHVDYKTNPREAMAVCQADYTRRTKNG